MADLSPGRQAQALPAVVVALDHEALAEAEEPGQDEAQPEQAGQSGPEPLAVGAEGELEEEEQQEREEAAER